VYLFALPPGFAVRVAVEPLQIVPVLVGAAVGVAFTVATEVAIVEQEPIA